MRIRLGILNALFVVSAFCPAGLSRDDMGFQPAVSGVKTRPEYPFDMRRNGIEGHVVVKFIVDVNGRTQDVVAVSASRREFIDAAIKSVQRWHYKPAIKVGAPIATRVQEVVTFSTLASGALDGAAPIEVK